MNNTVSDSEAEFVITAPAPFSAQLAYEANARMTLGALTQLLSNSKKSIIISAPFIQKGKALDNGPLANALFEALKRGVDVDIISTGNSIRSVNVEYLKSISKGTLRFLRPIANANDERKLGSHAKFCISDSLHAYIGSANLTGSGLSDNLEMGLLVHGQLALQIEQFIKLLNQINFFVEMNK